MTWSKTLDGDMQTIILYTIGNKNNENGATSRDKSQQANSIDIVSTNCWVALNLMKQCEIVCRSVNPIGMVMSN